VVITDDFVFVHMPKTGGTFVEAVLREALAGRSRGYLDTASRRKRFEKHATVSEIPPKHRKKRVVTSIRSPYDHLVSFYEFGWWREHPGDTFDEDAIRRRYPHYPAISFDEYVEAVYDWALLDPDYRSLPLAPVVQEADMGMLTLDYLRFLLRDPDPSAVRRMGVEDALQRAFEGVRAVRADALNEDTYELLVELGHAPDDVRFVLEKDRVNVSGGRDRARGWREYYSPDSKTLVRQKERALFALLPEYDE
jgi:hypothetical protein